MHAGLDYFEMKPQKNPHTGAIDFKVCKRQ